MANKDWNFVAGVKEAGLFQLKKTTEADYYYIGLEQWN